MYLLENQTSNVNGVGQEIQLRAYTDFIFICDGTFDGCTVKIEIKGKDEWVSCGSDALFTEGGACSIILRGGMYIRGTVIDAGASTNVSLEMI